MHGYVIPITVTLSDRFTRLILMSAQDADSKKAYTASNDSVIVNKWLEVLRKLAVVIYFKMLLWSLFDGIEEPVWG
jgi:hypothetical protein